MMYYHKENKINQNVNDVWKRKKKNLKEKSNNKLHLHLIVKPIAKLIIYALLKPIFSIN